MAGDETGPTFAAVIAAVPVGWYWRLQPGLVELWRPGEHHPIRAECEVGDELTGLHRLVRESGHERDAER